MRLVETGSQVFVCLMFGLALVYIFYIEVECMMARTCSQRKVDLVSWICAQMLVRWTDLYLSQRMRWLMKSRGFEARTPSRDGEAKVKPEQVVLMSWMYAEVLICMRDVSCSERGVVDEGWSF